MVEWVEAAVILQTHALFSCSLRISCATSAILFEFSWLPSVLEVNSGTVPLLGRCDLPNPFQLVFQLCHILIICRLETDNAIQIMFTHLKYVPSEVAYKIRKCNFYYFRISTNCIPFYHLEVLVIEISDVVYRNINLNFIFTLLRVDEQVAGISKRNMRQEFVCIVEEII
jgi:hypothetical protein